MTSAPRSGPLSVREGLEAEKGAVGSGGVGEEVKEAVRPGTHVSDPAVAIFEQMLLVDDPVALQLEPSEEPETGGRRQRGCHANVGTARRRTP